MNEPAEYVFRERRVRIITDRQRVPWFIAKDVCDILGTDTKDLRAILDTDEITNLDTIEVQPTAGRSPLIISESGFYKLVLRSRKPVAKEFQRWVTHNVLPSIREHGAYMTPDTIRAALADPDTIIALATRLKEETEQRQEAQRQIRTLEPKAHAFEEFCEAPGLSTVRDAAAMLTTAGVTIREGELRAWMLDHQWIYRKGNAYRPYAAHVQAGHLRLEPPHTTGRHRDGRPFTFEPTCKITRRGLALLWQRIGAERMRTQLDYNHDTLDIPEGD